MAVKYYAVRKGRKPGIYDNWAEAQDQVEGFRGNSYMSFPTLQEAEAFMAKGGISNKPLAKKKSSGKVQVKKQKQKKSKKRR